VASIRISATEIQVGHFIYTFDEPDDADSFEACVAAVDVSYCEEKHPCVSKKPVSTHPPGRDTHD
jgi:hypothetical protein